MIFCDSKLVLLDVYIRREAIASGNRTVNFTQLA